MAVGGGGRNWSGGGTLWRNFTAIDLATAAYVTIATCAVLYGVLFHAEGVPGWSWLLVAHTLIVALVVLAPRARLAGPVGRFLGDWYPMLLLAALYGEIGVLTLSAGFQNDLLIQRLETWVFGSQVSYRWIHESPSVVLSWLLHACYLAYYPILYTSPLALWMSDRRDASRHTIFAVMATFYLCYMRCGRRGLPPGCSIVATPGARHSRRHTSPRRSSQPAWRYATGGRWASCSCRSRPA